jgi:hypothetical protein
MTRFSRDIRAPRSLVYRMLLADADDDTNLTEHARLK